MTQTKKKDIEMVYGIYFGKQEGGYYGPCETKEAECVISENHSNADIIKHLVASDFLCRWGEYIVIDNVCSIHIHHKFNGGLGGIALVLLYQEDL